MCVCESVCVCVCVCECVCVCMIKQLACLGMRKELEKKTRKMTIYGNAPSAQGWSNRTLAVHERVNSRFLVLPESLSIFTQITGLKYFSLLSPRGEIKYKSE